MYISTLTDDCLQMPAQNISCLHLKAKNNNKKHQLNATLAKET